MLGLFGAALLYGDGVITPAISVLCAVEGLEVAAPGARAPRRADHASAILVCLFLVPEARAPAASARSSARSCSSGSRCIARARRARASSHDARRPARRLARSTRVALLRAQQRRARLPRARRASSSSSPAARRSTPTWATSGAADPARLVRRRAARRSLLNYFGQGALAPPRAGGRPEPVLRARARRGRSTRWSCSRPPPRSSRRRRSSPARSRSRTRRCSSATCRASPSCTPPGTERPDLHPRGQLGARASRASRSCSASRARPDARRRVRHRGDRHDGHHVAPLLPRRARPAGTGRAAGAGRSRSSSSPSTSPFFLANLVKIARRRLVPARRRPRSSSRS